MANLAYVETVRQGEHVMICIVNSAHHGSCGFRGCWWQLYDQDGKSQGHGMSKGWDKDGAGSALSAMKLAKAAAKRRLKRLAKLES